MKKQTNVPTYGWESAAVRAALEKRGWLWVSIGRGAFMLKGWYPPRIACYILRFLREAGSCQPTNEWVHQVVVCGPGQQPRHFGYYYSVNLVGLFGGLCSYYKKKNRQLRRNVRRSEKQTHKANLLLFLTGYKPDGKGGFIKHHAK